MFRSFSKMKILACLNVSDKNPSRSKKTKARPKNLAEPTEKFSSINMRPELTTKVIIHATGPEDDLNQNQESMRAAKIISTVHGETSKSFLVELVE